MALTKLEIKEILAGLKEQAELQAKINGSYQGYVEELKEAKKLNETIARNKKIEDDIAKKRAVAKTANNKKEFDEQTEVLNILKKQNALLQDRHKLLLTNLQEVNKTKMLFAKSGADIIKGIGSVAGQIKKSYLDFRDKGFFDMDKSVKQAALSMGVLSKQSEGFTKGLQDGALYSNQLGISLQELAKMQADYSSELGRSVVLSKDGLKAMSDIAAASGLGAEGAAKMVSDLDQFNLSAKDAGKFVDEVMDDSSAMGTNASKVVKTISENIKMLNHYNFKDGVKGLEKMAQTVTKLGVDMKFASGFADKLWDIEGAVDMSAQLQVLGGAWAKLADPFQLMYKARNDMEGLTQDIAAAAAASMTFAKDGSIKLSTMEMSRLKEVTKEMGVNFDEVVTAGQKFKKLNAIKSQVGFGMDEESKKLADFISNKAEFGKDGKATITFAGSTKLVSQLSEMDKTTLTQEMKEKESAAERAKASRTFDEALSDTINGFKVMLMPVLDSINKELLPKLQDLQKEFVKGDWPKKIGHFADEVGKTITWIGGIILDHPKAIAAAFIGGKVLGFMFETANWFKNGLALSAGFNAGNSATGGFFSMFKNMLSGTGGGGGLFADFKGLKAAGDSTAGAMGSATKWNLGQASGIMAGITGLISAIMEFKDNQSKGMATGENAVRSGAKGVGTGLGAWGGGMLGGAAAGAAAGAVGGLGAFDWATIPIGALIGGALGAWGGGAGGEAVGNAIYGPKANDAILSGGKLTPLDNTDDLLAMKKGGAIDKVVNKTAATDSVVKHEFGDLNINGQVIITTPGGGQVSADLLKDPNFIRSITAMITVEMQKNTHGAQRG